MKKIAILLLISVCSVLCTVAEELETGYRGFVDVESFVDAGGVSVGLNTTHGYQVTPHFFVGAGVGFDYLMTDWADGFFIPAYASVRGDFNVFGEDSRCSLFADTKIGAMIGTAAAFMVDPMVGLRIGLTEKLGLNIGLGSRVAVYDGEALASFAFKLGIDF